MNMQDYRIYASFIEECLVVESIRNKNWLLKAYIKGDINWEKMINILIANPAQLQFKVNIFPEVNLEIVDLKGNETIAIAKVKKIDFNKLEVLKLLIRR